MFDMFVYLYIREKKKCPRAELPEIRLPVFQGTNQNSSTDKEEREWPKNVLR